MKNYENIYILKGSMTESEALEEIEKIKEYFKNVKLWDENKNCFKCGIGLDNYQGLKNLAYEIKGEKTGYYYITHFTATENEVSKIENQLRLNDNVIKFITVSF